MNKYNTDDYEAVAQQYITDANLGSRVALHQNFSTNKYGWFKWVFDQIDLTEKKNILELGCGNGMLWKKNLYRIPDDISITLTDFSEGMVASAKNLVNGDSRFKYNIADAQNIPYESGEFDIVIANHMLYHMPDRKKAISEIKRVLKDDGIFYSTTNGINHMKDLKDIVISFDDSIQYSVGEMAKDFGLENGAIQLKEFFSDVKLIRYENFLRITDTEALLKYVMSSKGWGNISEKMTGSRIVDFREYLTEIMKKEGYIDIKTDSGMFISRY